MLKPDERAAVIEAVVDEVGDEVPVIAGVSAPSTRNTVSYARDAEVNGADAAVVGIPYYYPIDSTAIIEHYEEVTAAIDIPVYIYHFPRGWATSSNWRRWTGWPISTASSASRTPAATSPGSARPSTRTPNSPTLAGLDSLLFAELEIGCTGLVSAVSNVFPGLAVDLYESYVNGEENRARELQSTVFDIWKAIDRGPYLGGVKSALDLHPEVDFDPGPMRRPLWRMDEQEEVRARTDAPHARPDLSQRQTASALFVSSCHSTSRAPVPDATARRSNAPCSTGIPSQTSSASRSAPSRSA